MTERVAVHSVADEKGGRRIAVYRRPDGCYIYAEEWRVCFSVDSEFTWTEEFDHETRSCIYDSPERALKEAERVVLWLRERHQGAGEAEP